MAKRRIAKRSIHAVCTELWAECVAASLYAAAPDNNDVEALLHSIVKIEKDYISRISHIEPGLEAKTYFKDLTDKFNSHTSEIIDQINNLF